jgi:glycosyltransferase 2 family protein
MTTFTGMGRTDSARRFRRAALVGAALTCGVALAALAFFRVEWRGGPVLTPRFDLAAFVRRLPEHRRWLVPFMAVTALLSAWRALVWRLVLPAPPPPLTAAWSATAIGALVHNTVPGKVGPVAAAWLLARETRTPLGAALSSQLLAKLLELIAIVALGTLAAAVRGGAHGGAARAAAAGAALVVVLAAAAVALGRGGRRAALALAGRRPRVAAFVGAAADALREAAAGGRLPRAAAAALLPALTSACAYALPLAAFGVDRPLAAGALLLAMVTFGQLTPGLPVGAGVYYALAALTTRRLGASDADAAALAVLSHAATVATMVLVGLAAAGLRRGALAAVLAERRRAAAIRRASAAEAPGGGRAADARS